MKKRILFLFLLLNGFLHSQVVVSGDSVLIKAGMKTGDIKCYTYSTTYQRVLNGTAGPSVTSKSDLDILVTATTDTSYEVSWRYSDLTFEPEQEPVKIPEWKFQITTTGNFPKAIGASSDPYIPINIRDFYSLYGLSLPKSGDYFSIAQKAVIEFDTIPLKLDLFPILIDPETITIAGISSIDKVKLRKEMRQKIGDPAKEDFIQQWVNDLHYLEQFAFTISRKDGSIIQIIYLREEGSEEKYSLRTFKYELVTD